MSANQASQLKAEFEDSGRQLEAAVAGSDVRKHLAAEMHHLCRDCSRNIEGFFSITSRGSRKPEASVIFAFYLAKNSHMTRLLKDAHR